jgi:hypothetical protein
MVSFRELADRHCTMSRMVLGAVLGVWLNSGSASALAQTSCGPLKPECSPAQDANETANAMARLPSSAQEQCLRAPATSPLSSAFEAVRACLALEARAAPPVPPQAGEVGEDCLRYTGIPPGRAAFEHVATCHRQAQASRQGTSKTAQPTETALDRCMRSTLVVAKAFVRSAVEKCLAGPASATTLRSDPLDTRAGTGTPLTNKLLGSDQ